MSKFCSFFSGSSGNCSYVSNADSGFLIDAGTSARSILTSMKNNHIDQNTIKGIFITHEHEDHIKGLRVLLKTLKVPIYASQPTLNFLMANNHLQADTSCIVIESEKPAVIHNNMICAFSTMHDSNDSQGYKFFFPDGRTLGFATDLGTVDETVFLALQKSDVVVLESNYDSSMLDCCSYPYYLKRRIKSNVGHLDNAECATTIGSLIQNGSTHFILAHLSKECNHPELALETCKSELSMRTMKLGVDYTMQVASRKENSPMIVF